LKPTPSSDHARKERHQGEGKSGDPHTIPSVLHPKRKKQACGPNGAVPDTLLDTLQK
jgi:hypothetical protein